MAIIEGHASAMISLTDTTQTEALPAPGAGFYWDVRAVCVSSNATGSTKLQVTSGAATVKFATSIASNAAAPLSNIMSSGTLFKCAANENVMVQQSATKATDVFISAVKREVSTLG